MSTKIRLMRMGSMKRPFYRLVVMDSRNRRDGRYIENLGTYNPIAKVDAVTLREDRILDWLMKGAVLTGTPKNLCRDAGIMEKYQMLKDGVAPDELEGKLAERRAKQPKGSDTTLSRTEKKAKKKTDARVAAEAEKAAAEKAEESTEA
ncbi:MAG: 30S ribosomal protein S16 [bacterium]|nr:30S ribosomal protein S16 [bacterium]